MAAGRNSLVKGDSRDAGEVASLFQVKRRGAERAVAWGLLWEMRCFPRELRRRRLGHVLARESVRLGLVP